MEIGCDENRLRYSRLVPFNAMRILLIGNYAPDRQQSMLRFATLLERELTARGHEVTLLQPQARVRVLSPASGLSKWLGYVDKFLLFPRTLRRIRHGFDVVHLCDHSNAMYVRDLGDVPHVVTCHDVLAIRSALGEIPQNPTGATGRRLQALILAGLKRARYIVNVSAATELDMRRVTGREAAGSTVVYSSLNYPYTPMPANAARTQLQALGVDAGQPFYLHVGGGSWYKNRLELLKIFAELATLLPTPTRLLIIGAPLEPELEAFARHAGIMEKISHVSEVTNEDLRAAYSLAEGLIFPSLIEGFGWPVLEAQACGCPVFATARAPMTEVGGQAAVYFDPDETAFAAQIIARHRPEAAKMRAAGLDQVKHFSVEQMIVGYVRAYEYVMSATQSGSHKPGGTRA